jgi:Uma2 family endonuclease
MAESAKPHRHMSVEEYLEFEEGSSVKHEYVDGMVYAQAGASDRHNRISGKIYRRLADTAEGTPCRVYMSDMRLFVSGNTFYYPDVMVACEPPETDNPTFRRDPCLIVEVTSPSTAQTDRREKLTAYRKLPTLRAYLIVEQNEARIEHHFRDENDEWWRAELTGGTSIPLPCPPDAELSVSDIYEGL